MKKRWVLASLWVLALVAGGAYGEDSEFSVYLKTVGNPGNAMAPVPGEGTEFNMRSSMDRAKLGAEIDKLLALADLQKRDSRRKLPNPFPFDISGGGKRALETVKSLLAEVARGGAEGRSAVRTIDILLTAFNHNYDYPVRRRFQLLPDLPRYLYKGFHHLRVYPDERGDDGRKDPPGSTFWSRMENDGSVDLRAGFNRAAPADLEKDICSYKAAKDGWGAHPGFKVKCAGETYKFKLGDEIYSGPFNTRIYWLAGYNVLPIDRVDELKVAYDRRILSEFHSRKHLEFELRFLAIPLKKFVVTNYTDPFVWIAYAQMKDGRKLPGAALKRALLKRIPEGDPTSPDYQRPETMPGNYREDFEAGIEYLAFVPGTAAHDTDSVKPIGPWKYDEFDVDQRREVRAILALSAWVGNYNMRWENTRVSFVEENGQWSWKHFLSDVGSGLGDATRIMRMTNSEVGKMKWRVTEPHRREGVKLSGIQQNDTDNPTFASMTYEDAQWMIRIIARISDAQIWDALGAARMPAASRRLAFEKLLSRRAHMVRDFGLAREFPAIVRRPVNERFSFTPTAADGYGWDRQKVVQGELVELKK